MWAYLCVSCMTILLWSIKNLDIWKKKLSSFFQLQRKCTLFRLCDELLSLHYKFLSQNLKEFRLCTETQFIKTFKYCQVRLRASFPKIISICWILQRSKHFTFFDEFLHCYIFKVEFIFRSFSNQMFSYDLILKRFPDSYQAFKWFEFVLKIYKYGTGTSKFNL